MEVKIPHPGQVVIVRDRPAVVKDVKAAKTSDQENIHGIWVSYIDGFSYPENDFIIWERELNCRVIRGVSLPEVDKLDQIDDPDIFHSFINCFRWSSTNRISDLTTKSNIKLVSPWQSAIQLEKYQLYPVLKALSMPRITMLLADDVGLGKTIEAGLIVNELIARGRLRRILIVCPAALQVQWRDEMAEKFYIDFNIVNRESTYQLQKEFGLDSNPWSSYSRIITSIDYLRQRDVLQSFLGAAENYSKTNDSVSAWDMVIVDEAHNIASRYLGEETERLKMIKQILPHFENRLLLTATPHNGYTESFTGLLELLNPLVFEQKRTLEEKDYSYIHNYVVRRMKSDFKNDGLVKKFTDRFINRVDPDYKLTEDEKSLFSAFRIYKNKLLRLAEKDSFSNKTILHFLISLLTKRLLSSPYAFANTWWNHFAGIETENIDETEVKHAIERAEAELVDDSEKDTREDEVARKIGSWFKEHFTELKPEIENINKALSELGWSIQAVFNGPELPDTYVDSKWDALQRWIEQYLTDKKQLRKDERVIIFTEYKHTLDFLVKKFEKAGLCSPKIETLFGGASQNKREDIKHYFTDADSPLRILLVTDVASEGINLQNNCRYIIHYEIPWNPMRLEQRNGRVDRFGQNRDVGVFHFIADDEEDLKFLERIVKKVEQIREDLGSVGDLFDQNLTRYFLSAGGEHHKYTQFIDEIKPADFETSDLNNTDKGTADNYGKAFQFLSASENEMELSPENIAGLLKFAFKIEGGELSPHPAEKEVYQINTIPPKWKELIESSLTVKHGRNTGARYKLVFDSSYFEEIKNGRMIYLNKPDAKLIRLGHPLFKRALGLIKKKLWGVESASGAFNINRFTVAKSHLPHGISEVIVLHLLVEATNKLREKIHEETISIPLLPGNKKPEKMESELWQQIKTKHMSALSREDLNKWLPVIREKWLDMEDEVKKLIENEKTALTKNAAELSSKCLPDELERISKLYDERFRELKEKKSSRYIEKLKNDLKAELARPNSFFEDIEQERQGRIREIEVNIQKIMEDKIFYLESILKTEKERMINRVIPKRFTLDSLEVYPLGVEIILNEKILN